MAQRDTQKVFIATLEAQGLSPFLIDKMREGVRSPVTDRGSGWDFLKWFIRLARTDVRQLRAGDLLNLQEDLMKFLSLGSLLKITMPPPSIEELENLQKTLSKHLHELMDGGKTCLGPFGSTIIAIRQTFKPTPESEETAFFSSMNIPTEPEKWLVHEFARLLEKYGSLLSKCLHCGQIFLQLRTNALYCDRKCQSVAATRKIRAERKKANEDESRKRQKGRRNKHGKTRR